MTREQKGYVIRCRSNPDAFAQNDDEDVVWGPFDTAYVWTEDERDLVGLTQYYLDGMYDDQDLVEVQIVTTVRLAK
jgi:hypothetical protein